MVSVPPYYHQQSSKDDPVKMQTYIKKLYKKLYKTLLLKTLKIYITYICYISYKKVI